MKKNKKYIKLDYTLTLYIMLAILIAVVIFSLTATLINAISENLLPSNPSFIFLIIGLSLMLVISIILSYFVNKFITKYIKTIQFALRKVSNGEFNTTFKKSKNKYINEIIDDFNKMVNQLNSVPLLRKDFVSNFSHEFKTPLVSIKGFAEILQTKSDLTQEEKNEYLQIIIDECTRLTNLANDTLLISKLDTQTNLTNTKKIYLDEQIDQCLFILDKRLKEKNIDIKTKLISTPYSCDADLLQQVWINILDNAIKFTKNKIEIKMKKDDNNVIIVIKDNGKGISEEHLPHIFEKFYQADTSHSLIGSGLGLATASKIIKLHDGIINVNSEKNKYTQFTITLPIQNN